MVKTRIAVCSLLLLLSVLITVFNVNVTNATNVAVEWGYLNTNPQYYDPVERDYQEDTCLSINNRYNLAGGWSAQDAYWDLTTQSNIIKTIQWRQQNNSWATDFYVGDYIWTTPSGVKHYNLYGNGGYINDNSIYSETSYSVQYFSFIWACACGDLFTNPITGQLCYGYYDYATGAVGMPLAWTHTGGLNHYGYIDPDQSRYCYIGFENTSKPLKEEIITTGYSYSWFVYYFYDHALGWGPGNPHHTIQECLYHASMQVYGGVPFDQCTLYTGYWDNYSTPGQSFYCRMRVYGNSLINLPY